MTLFFIMTESRICSSKPFLYCLNNFVFVVGNKCSFPTTFNLHNMFSGVSNLADAGNVLGNYGVTIGNGVMFTHVDAPAALIARIR